MISPHKPLDEIQPNLVFEFFNECGVQQYNHFGPAPLGPGEGSNVKYHYISITKSISEVFIPNFLCVLTNTKYINYVKRYFYSIA